MFLPVEGWQAFPAGLLGSVLICTQQPQGFLPLVTVEQMND
jgi:hypothetical protein